MDFGQLYFWVPKIGVHPEGVPVHAQSCPYEQGNYALKAVEPEINASL